MNDFLVKAESITKKYSRQKKNALTNVNLTFKSHELVAVIGANGAGKSTLFDIIGGLIRPTSGNVIRNVGTDSIGWCPQREIVDWSLTVSQNILLGMDLRTARFNKFSEVEEIAKVFGLSNYLHRTAETLSGGELRRTQIARAVVGNPQFLILDEPTTGLDPSGIKTVFSYLKERVSDGVTVLVSTHETSKFSEYCTRVVAINQGSIIADEPVADFMKSAPNSNDLWDVFTTLVESKSK